jgi:hypothetical protein
MGETLTQLTEQNNQRVLSYVESKIREGHEQSISPMVLVIDFDGPAISQFNAEDMSSFDMLMEKVRNQEIEYSERDIRKMFGYVEFQDTSLIQVNYPKGFVRTMQKAQKEGNIVVGLTSRMLEYAHQGQRFIELGVDFEVPTISSYYGNKSPFLKKIAKCGARVVFVDDLAENVIDAASVPGVLTFWFNERGDYGHNWQDIYSALF